MRIAQHLIWGGTQTKAPPSIAAHIASNAIEFFRVTKKSRLLPLNAADRVWSNLVEIKKGGEHQSQILASKRRITCPLKRGRSIDLFEVYSAFTRVTACTLALSPIRDTHNRRLQLFRYLHSCSGCFRLEHLPGGGFTHWESAAFSRRTPTAVNQRAGISARYLTLGDAKRQVDFCTAAENARLG
jgi:hypothetical protein